MEIVPVNFTPKKGDFPPPPTTFNLNIDSVLFKEKEENIFEIFPVKLTIPYGQTVCLY